MRFLLDCDGVLSDFSTHVLGFINGRLGEAFLPSDICHSDVFTALGVEWLEQEFREYVAKGGFCSTMPLMNGSKPAVERLNRLGEVFVVTTPFDAATWVPERAEWLRRNFGIDKNHVVFTAAKHVVSGDVLVDDMPNNLVAWKHANPKGRALLVDSPWNKGFACDGVTRIKNLDDVVNVFSILRSR